MHDEMMTDPAADPLALEIAAKGMACYALQARKTANVVARAYNAVIAGEGLEVSQFSTLCAIALGNSHSVSELAEGLGVDRSTLVRNLARLERLGLIARHEQGRRVRHALEPAGRALLERALPRWSQVQDQIGQALSGLPATDTDPRAAMTRLRRAARTLPLPPHDAVPG
jgi:DNA-binding MarR family transcriptional regulator